VKVSLICKEEKFKIIKTLLLGKGLEVEKDSGVIFIDKGFDIEIEDKIHISFNSDDLNQLLDFIDEFYCFDNRENKDFVVTKTDDNIKLIALEKIQFLEADNNNVYCIIEDDKQIYKIKGKLYELEEKFESQGFIRVSKSNIINIKNISHIVPWFDNKLVIKFKGTRKKVEVTRTYLKKFKNYLGV